MTYDEVLEAVKQAVLEHCDGTILGEDRARLPEMSGRELAKFIEHVAMSVTGRMYPSSLVDLVK
jgi:hypothetical protein